MTKMFLTDVGYRIVSYRFSR